MSVDNFKQEFHLTPDGWMTGSSWFYGKLEEAKPIVRPIDAFETWEFTEVQSSQYSAPETRWLLTWQRPGVSQDELLQLHNKYPERKTKK